MSSADPEKFLLRSARPRTSRAHGSTGGASFSLPGGCPHGGKSRRGWSPGSPGRRSTKPSPRRPSWPRAPTSPCLGHWHGNNRSRRSRMRPSPSACSEPCWVPRWGWPGASRCTVGQGGSAGRRGRPRGGWGGGALTASVLTPIAEGNRILASESLFFSFLIHGGIWSAVGAAGGLAFGLGLGGRGTILRATVGGFAAGASSGTIVYDLIGALAFPMAGTGGTLATVWATRLLAHVCVAIAAALGVAAAVQAAWVSHRPGRILPRILELRPDSGPQTPETPTPATTHPAGVFLSPTIPGPRMVFSRGRTYHGTDVPNKTGEPSYDDVRLG